MFPFKQKKQPFKDWTFFLLIEIIKTFISSHSVPVTGYFCINDKVIHKTVGLKRDNFV